MSKYSFLDDYSEGCHPNILKALTQSNMHQQTAYGDDEYSAQARALINKQLDTKDTPVYFVASGTLANLVCIAASLRPHEAVIAASTGHIVLRETGAIEATGHKIITVTSADGKLTSPNIEAVLASNAHAPHMAKPRLVYISNATETGTIYTKSELEGLASVCKENDLLLLLDGARLGVALTAGKSDLTLKDIAELTDIFWIGGTKAGALLGEAIVIPNKQLAQDFAFHIKQRGGLLAKGRLLGIQFAELFTDGLYFELSQHANLMAQKLSAALVANGHRLASPTESNQVFSILPDTLIDHLKANYDFYVWEKADDQHSVVRFVTSWATDESQVDALIRVIQNNYGSRKMSQITSVEQLEELYKPPGKIAKNKVLSSLDHYAITFIEKSHFSLLSSSDEKGFIDVSPRGGEPGFIKVMDSQTLLIPDSSGNRRLDSLRNILVKPEVGLLFMVSGVDEVVRVKGVASIHYGDEFANICPDGNKAPKTVIKISVESMLFHCAKAIMRGKLWEGDYGIDRDFLPSLAEIMKDQLNVEGAFVSQEDMVKGYKQSL